MDIRLCREIKNQSNVCTQFMHLGLKAKAEETVHAFLDKVEQQYSLIIETRDFMTKLKQIQVKFRERSMFLKLREDAVKDHIWRHEIVYLTKQF